MKVDRRRFLGFSIGAAAGTAAGVPASRTISEVIAGLEPAVFPPGGPEDTVLSICRMCCGGCGVRVRRVGSRAVKLDGNPLHPVNRGGLCPRGQAALQGLYHPDRVPGPLRRVGPKGSMESFERATWDEALDEIAARLTDLRAAGRPESVVLLHDGEETLGTRMAQRFLAAFGSPNDVAVHRGEEAAAVALELTQGVRAVPAFDVRSTEYVLSFGGALLEAWSSPVYMSQAYGDFRQGHAGRRGKLVQAESRLSITAGAADEWLAVRPGTEGVLALGIAQVVIAEGLYDRSFVFQRTSGFDELRSLLERDYRLEPVSAMTGVPVNVILRVAREFATARAGLAVGPRRGPLLPGRLFDHLAAGVLNALVGGPDAPGGVLVPEEVPLAAWPQLPDDPVAAAGRRRPRLDAAGTDNAPHLRSDPEQLAEAVLASSPYAVEAAIVLGADPAFTSAAPERLSAALEKIPFVVSFASLADDTALYADWILPEAHFLESWQLSTTPPGVPYPLVSLGQPAVESLHDVRPAVEILLDLARRVGGEVAAAFPWPDLQGLIRQEVDSLFQARRGAIMGTAFDEAWVRMMERSGWWAPGYRTAAELWQRMKESGGWWDPFYDHGDWPRVLRTASGKLELPTALLVRLAKERSAAGGAVSSASVAPEARSATTAAAAALPLVLFEPLPVAGGRGAELPFLQEILDPGHQIHWESWVEIHPDTAARLGIGDRDLLRVASAAGSIEARARVTSRVVADVAAMPVGLGKRAGGRWARGRGANPLRLLAAERDAGSALPDFGATRVELNVIQVAAGHHEPRS